MAAIAALTEVAVAEARDETEQSLRGSFLEELLTRTTWTRPTWCAARARLGCDLAAGCAALCGDPGGRGPGRLVAALAAERAGRAGADRRTGKVYALLPGRARGRARVATRLGRHATVGSPRTTPAPPT